ncbi:PfkB family carbohydrate kinase [Bacteroidota bacterium]
MKQDRIREILDKIKQAKVAVYGDFCLDVYWIMDPRGSEVSVETGLQAQAVQKQSYTPGGASNIVANLAALEPAEIKLIGVIGDDIFGRELMAQLSALNADISELIIQNDQFDTYAFTKKYNNDEEEPRIDFGVYNARLEETDQLILKGIRRALETYEVLIFNQQIPGSLTRPEFIHEVNHLFDEFNDKIVVLDSRHYGEKFNSVYRKINSTELARLNGIMVNPDDYIPLSSVERYGQEAFKKSGKPVYITCGERGIVTVDSSGVHLSNGIQFLNKLDPVGAGDTTLSALALCLAAGIGSSKAATFANLAAGVTVQKLFTTGSATGDEIITLGEDPDFLYNSDLADDAGLAKYLQGTHIEICEEPEGGFRSIPIKHALFDHDGTISTLRTGWDIVMEEVMVQCILGDSEIENHRLYDKVVERVREYIDKSTGVQTIVQMQGLVTMVEDFNEIPAENILTAREYKEIFNDALMGLVKQRIGKIERGEPIQDDFIIPGSLDFLSEIKKRQVKLYLASGTDHADVENESSLMGYAHLFDGGIYGSQGDIKRYSKKKIIKEIIENNRLKGSDLIVFGDGPVEIKECRKMNGIAVGVATDEIHKNRLNLDKRSRLVKAGAHIVIPEFTETAELMNLLFK